MKCFRYLIISSCFFIVQQSSAQEWKIYADSARYFLGEKNNAKALAAYLKAGELLQKDSASTLTHFRNSNDIGDCYTAMGQYPKAEPYYTEAKQLIEKLAGKENADYALLCNNLGRLQRLMGQYEKAELLLIEAKALREKLFGKENADYATSVNNLAVLYGEVGQYSDAAPLYLEAKQIRERVLGRDHIDYASSCNNLAILYVLTGRPAEAEPLYLEAKRIREKILGKEHPFYAASCNNLAALYLDMGQYKKAEPLYIEAKGIRERTLGIQHPDYASSCDNLAILYMDLGNYETAEALYKEAKQIRENALGTKHIEYAKSCNNMALLYKLLGQYDKAAALFAESKEIFFAAVGKDHFEYGKCCNNLGAVYMDMGNYEKAAPLYTEAKAVWEKVLGKEHPEYAKSCHNLALVHLRNNEFDQAEALLMEANTIRANTLGREHPDFAEGCDNLATLYLKKNEIAKAIELEIQAKQIREKVLGVAHPDYLQSCINLANIYRSQNNDAMAVNLYTEAFSSQQALLQKIFRFTTEPEKQAYLKKVNEYRNYFLSFITSSPNAKGAVYAYEVSIANKNLILNAAQRLRQIINGTGDTALVEQYNRWINAREQLAFWYARPVNERKIQVAQLEEEANALEKQLISSSESFRREQQETSWKTIQQSLNAGEAAVEFSTFQYDNGKRLTDSVNYFAVIIRKDRPAPELVMLFEKKELDLLLGTGKGSPGLQRINYLYKFRAPAAGRKNSSLYSLLWQPLEEKLAGIKTVYFSPAGDLYKLAFAAVPVSNTASLSDKYQLLQLNTTGAVAGRQETTIAGNSKINLYGGVQYDVDSTSIRKAVMAFKTDNSLAKRSLPEDLLIPGISEFSFLVESEKEVKEIGKLAKQKNYEVNMLNGINATEESIKAMTTKNEASVLHIATHGFFFPDPVRMAATATASGAEVFRQSDNPLIRSGLALAGANNAWKGNPVAGVEDGILTAYEVSNMYLPNTKLAVLSACETGLGEIQGSEGVYGLQRAFKMAGVENLVMSLWKVPDAETAEFMEEFYKNLFSQQAISLAFYNAQKTMKNKYRNEPFKWAAWVLVR